MVTVNKSNNNILCKFWLEQKWLRNPINGFAVLGSLFKIIAIFDINECTPSRSVCRGMIILVTRNIHISNWHLCFDPRFTNTYDIKVKIKNRENWFEIINMKLERCNIKMKKAETCFWDFWSKEFSWAIVFWLGGIRKKLLCIYGNFAWNFLYQRFRSVWG